VRWLAFQCCMEQDVTFYEQHNPDTMKILSFLLLKREYIRLFDGPVAWTGKNVEDVVIRHAGTQTIGVLAEHILGCIIHRDLGLSCWCTKKFSHHSRFQE
jgi:hypothetical protein